MNDESKLINYCDSCFARYREMKKANEEAQTSGNSPTSPSPYMQMWCVGDLGEESLYARKLKRIEWAVDDAWEKNR